VGCSKNLAIAMGEFDGDDEPDDFLLHQEAEKARKDTQSKEDEPSKSEGGED
jgi:SET domain-containing protein